jgi:hypothetical protein
MIWYLALVARKIFHFWSYANSIETAVLIVIIYDVVWHRLNVKWDIKRDEDAEKRAVLREEALEKRQIQRERREFIRKHWQELQYNLIALSKVATHMDKFRKYILEKKDSQDATTRRVLEVMTNTMPDLISEFEDYWGRVVSQLNVFPPPRDVLALEIIPVVLELGKTAGDKQIEIKDETLAALADLVTKVADKGTLLNVDD